MSMTSFRSLVLGVALGVSTYSAMSAAETVPVTVDNFVRAETDLYIGSAVKVGTLGNFHHHRELTAIDKQNVIRMNRDTLYSSVVCDLEASPATITLPDAGPRFMSMMLVNQDHYVMKVVYGKGTYTLTREQIGSRYVLAAIRTLVDPGDPQDLKRVHALQDAMTVTQERVGAFEVPAWDPVSQKKIRDALLVLGATMPDLTHAFGTKEQVDPIRHFIGTALAWGGNPDQDAVYLNVTPTKNDGTSVYRLTVKEVPVDAFWSISVYDAKGYFAANPQNAYSLNNLTAKKGADGAITIQFGGTPDGTVNHLPVTPGWNYTVRLYRPRKEILEGSWKFPEPQRMN